MSISQTSGVHSYQQDFIPQDQGDSSSSASSIERPPSKLQMVTDVNRPVKIFQTYGPGSNIESVQNETVPLLRLTLLKPDKKIRTNLTLALFSVQLSGGYNRICFLTEQQDQSHDTEVISLLKDAAKIQKKNARVCASELYYEIFKYDPLARYGTPPLRTEVQYDPLSLQSQDTLFSKSE